MKQLQNLYDLGGIIKEIGSPYSLLEKLKTFGIGSSKVVFLKGIPSFEKLSQSSSDLAYTNFEIYPDGLVARITQTRKSNAIVIGKDEIESIQIESRKIGSELVLDQRLYMMPTFNLF